MSSKLRHSLTILLPVLCAAEVLLLACQEDRAPQTGSETNFLVWCPEDGDCGDLICLCGVCTDPCEEDAVCEQFSPQAVCVEVSDGAFANACDGEARSATCELPCEADSDCDAIGAEHRCDRGFCRSIFESCERGETDADEVLVLGDLFLAASGEVVQELEALAQSSGALGEGEHYRDAPSTVTTEFGGGQDADSSYTLALGEGTPEVVLLNLGGPDALIECPIPVTADCPSLSNAVAGAQALFSRMSDDGVEAVVLFFYPDPEEAGLAEKFDVLRPLMRNVCESAPVPCHFVDLVPVFTGNEAEYLMDGGVLPTAAGARATAEVLFSVMQRNCVAQ